MILDFQGSTKSCENKFYLPNGDKFETATTVIHRYPYVCAAFFYDVFCPLLQYLLCWDAFSGVLQSYFLFVLHTRKSPLLFFLHPARRTQQSLCFLPSPKHC